MIDKIKFSNEAASALVRDRIRAINPKVEVVDERKDGITFSSNFSSISGVPGVF
jgi:hypothetical protein